MDSVALDRPNDTEIGHQFYGKIPDYTRENPWILIIPEEYIVVPGIYMGIRITGLSKLPGVFFS